MPGQITADSRYQLILEAQYGRVYNALQARVLSRVQTSLDIVGLFAGTTAIGAAIGESSWVAAAAAVIVALLPILSQTLDLRGKALCAKAQEQSFVAVLRDASSLNDGELERRIWAARGADHIEGLRWVAHNATLEEAGIPSTRPLDLWERLLRALA